MQKLRKIICLIFGHKFEVKTIWADPPYQTCICERCGTDASWM